ncbi:hypothetical protein C7H85_02125 [Zobellella endophytica]|uniref:Lipocalin-like domain-containing protein n=1 Tax=Zobellella endophytica TaxID=2116700 RepID=A0A2P7RBU8_9GAMM|nr:hypothetical protein [Zobellella endophytica]PSJ47650.1 hypothetical protein C7H85_02125 [Zobellella endophytica]
MKEFLGKWKIVEMEQWDQEYIDLVEPGYIRFDKDDLGNFVFGTVRGEIDCRYTEKPQPKLEFSWEGNSECDPASGRGWAIIEKKNEIYGMLYIHLGDESWFKASK